MENSCPYILKIPDSPYICNTNNKICLLETEGYCITWNGIKQENIKNDNGE